MPAEDITTCPVQRCLAYGCTFSEVVHDFITSIYTRDPDDNMIEFTCNTAELTTDDERKAHELLTDDTPAVDPDYSGTLYFPDGRVLAAPSSVCRTSKSRQVTARSISQRCIRQG